MLTTIITTLNHNIGDDFVREGILSLLKTASPKVLDERVQLIHKHSPLTSFYGFENFRSLRASRVLEPALRSIGAPGRIRDATVLVQSGAPIYWCHPAGPHCSRNEWFDPLVRKGFLKDRRERKFLNIAGGSCQEYHSDGSEIEDCGKCREYIREFFDVCDLTILRDVLARTMLAKAGRDASVLPCASIFARDRFKTKPRAGEYIVLNFMENGGHFVFGQQIDTEKWRMSFRKLASTAAKRGKVILACHNKAELVLARQIAPSFESFLVPNDHAAFVEFYSGARFGIVNRVHAAFMMASFGKPAAVVGTDSRARMIQNMNLPSYYVEDVGDIEFIIDDIAGQEKSYREVSSEIRRRAREEYVGRLSAFL